MRVTDETAVGAQEVERVDTGGVAVRFLVRSPGSS